jgi:hypothetical protein
VAEDALTMFVAVMHFRDGLRYAAGFGSSPQKAIEDARHCSLPGAFSIEEVSEERAKELQRSGIMTPDLGGRFWPPSARERRALMPLYRRARDAGFARIEWADLPRWACGESIEGRLHFYGFGRSAIAAEIVARERLRAFGRRLEDEACVLFPLTRATAIACYLLRDTLPDDRFVNLLDLERQK